MPKTTGPIRTVPSVKDPFAQNPNANKNLSSAVEKRISAPPVTPATPANALGPKVPPAAVRNVPPPIMSAVPNRRAIGRRMKKKPTIR